MITQTLAKATTVVSTSANKAVYPFQTREGAGWTGWAVTMVAVFGIGAAMVSRGKPTTTSLTMMLVSMALMVLTLLTAGASKRRGDLAMAHDDLLTVWVLLVFATCALLDGFVYPAQFARILHVFARGG